MDNIIFGIRPVAEAIEAGKQIEKLYIRKGAEGQLMQELKDLCMRHRLHYQEVPVEKLNRLTRGNHQGVVAQTAAIEYVQLADILERVPEDGIKRKIFCNEKQHRTNGAVFYSAINSRIRSCRQAFPLHPLSVLPTTLRWIFRLNDQRFAK